MTDFLYYSLFIISILVTILFVVGTHEFAHFAVARLVGVKVLRFSIGFGKTLWSRRDKSGTEYVFALIPLGGYVQMLGESGEENVSASEAHQAYHRQPYYKKCLIVLAGPAMNLLCAFLLYWIIFVIGFVTVKPVIGQVIPHSIASQAGMKANTEIVSVDFDSVNNWAGVMFRLLAHIGDNNSMAVGTQPLNSDQKSLHTLDLTHWKIDGLSPDPLSSLGIMPYEPPMPLIIGYIADSSPAAASSLKVGDKIIAVNNERVNNWEGLMKLIKANPGNNVTLSVIRAGKTTKVETTIGIERNWRLKKSGYLGIGPNVEFPPEMLRTVQHAPLAAIPQAFRELNEFMYFNFVLFTKLFSGKLSVQTLGGPITIFDSAGKALNNGIVPFLGFLAFLSVCVGAINLIPIPGLDGGHILFETIEFIIQRPLPQPVVVGLYYMGFAFIMYVLTQALVNDVLRLV